MGGAATGRIRNLLWADLRNVGIMIVRGRGTDNYCNCRMARRREDIFEACRRGDKDTVSRIISAGIDPRQVRNPDFWARGEKLLHTASRYVMYVHSSRL